MRTFLRELGFAILAWLIPFVISVCIFHLKKSHPPLFESMMGLTLVSTIVILGCIELRHSNQRAIARGLRIGLIWMPANWLLDAAMFSAGPMKMSLHQYLTEIGTAYFIIPVITVGLGVAARSR